MSGSMFITGVEIRNYKSIAACKVELGPLSFLVGPNGAGKSNFLDALRFVADSLRYSLEHALRDRGGIGEVRRRSAGHPTHFGIRIDFVLGSRPGHYSFMIGARPDARFEVQSEECAIGGPAPLVPEAKFVVEGGEVRTSLPGASPARSGDRLYLVNLSGVPEFRPAYDALSRMGFYNLNPDRIRDLQAPDPGELLARDGSNLASVFAQLTSREPETKARIEQYLGKVVPGVEGVEARDLGPRQTLEFRQDTWRFFAAGMSDGTLRALGVLVALFQRIPLVGIEEPEAGLHPAAARVLLDALRDASRNTQVVVSSHSADLLDDPALPAGSILAFENAGGASRIANVTERLYTAGDPLRPETPAVPADRQSPLFDEAQG